MNKFIGVLALILGVCIFLFIVLLPPLILTVLFFCIDDHLAMYTGVPSLGTLSYGFVYIVSLLIIVFFRIIFRGRNK